MIPARPQLPPLSEAHFQARVVAYAKLLGLLVFHDYDSRRSAAGFPDLVIVGNRVIFVELKTETGRIRPEQQTWLNRLRDAGATAAVWRPSDWDAAVAVLKGLR